jgi:SsrA-binding protein
MKKNEILNKKIKFKYHLIEKYISGIQLLGVEVKSIKNKKVNITESFCQIVNNEIFVKNLFIEKYEFNTSKSYNPVRDKKLLLKKNQIQKIKKHVIEKGYTIIPEKIFTNKNGFLKMTLFICKGKKTYDKRYEIKKKDLQLEYNRNIKIKNFK